jgi:hypothetical protein
MSNKLTELRNKLFKQLEEHTKVERIYFKECLENQEMLMQLQSQNWWLSWVKGYLENKIRSLGFEGDLYQDIDETAAKDLSDWQKNIVKKNLERRKKGNSHADK